MQYFSSFYFVFARLECCGAAMPYPLGFDLSLCVSSSSGILDCVFGLDLRVL